MKVWIETAATVVTGLAAVLVLNSGWIEVAS